MRERAENTTPKLLLIAGAENKRGMDAVRNTSNPSSRTVAYQSAAHRDNLINKHFLYGRACTVVSQQPKTSGTVINRRSLRNPMEWE